MTDKKRFADETAALEVFMQARHPCWHDAYAWLLDHGSPDTRQALIEAGRSALKSSFGVEFDAKHVTAKGERVITLEEIAEKLDAPISDLIEFLEQEGIEPLREDDIFPVN